MENAKNMKTTPRSNMHTLDDFEVFPEANNQPRKKNIPDIITSKHKRISIVQNSHIDKNDMAESLIIDPKFEEIDSTDKHKVHDMSKQRHCQIDQFNDTPLPNQYKHSPEDPKYTPNNTPLLDSQDRTNSNLNKSQNSPKCYSFPRMNNAETSITKFIKTHNNKCDVSLSSVFKPKLGTPTFNRSVLYTGGSKVQDNNLTKLHIVFTPPRITNTIASSMNQVNSDRQAINLTALKPKTMNNSAVTKTPNINRGRYIADNLITSDRYQDDNTCELNGTGSMVSHSPWKSLHRQYLFANLKTQNHYNNKEIFAQNEPKLIPGSVQNETRLRKVNSTISTSAVSHKPGLSMLQFSKALDSKTMKSAVEVGAINSTTPTGVDVPKPSGQKIINNSTDLIDGEYDKSKTQKDISPLVHYLENDLEDHRTVNERYRFRKYQVPAIQIIQNRIKEKFIKYQEQNLQNSKLEVNEGTSGISLNPTTFSQLETDSSLSLNTDNKYVFSSSPKVKKLNNQLKKDESIISDENSKNSFLKKNIETSFRKESDQNPSTELDDKTYKPLNIETSFQQLESISCLENEVLPSQTVNSSFEKYVPHLASPDLLNGPYKPSDCIPTFQVDELNIDEKINSGLLHSVSSTKIAPKETDLSPAQSLNSQLKLELCLDFTKSLWAIDTKHCSKARVLYKKIKNCEEKMKIFQTWQKVIRKERSQLSKKFTDKLERNKCVERSDIDNWLSKAEYNKKIFPQIEQMLNSLQTKIDNLELQKHDNEEDANEIKKLEIVQNIKYLQKLEAFDNEVQSLFDLRFAEMDSQLIEKSDKLLGNMISKYNEITQQKAQQHILEQDDLQQGDEKSILNNAQVAMNCKNQLSDPETKLNEIEKMLIQMKREWIKSPKNPNIDEIECEKVTGSADEQVCKYNFKSEEQLSTINNQEVKKLRGLIHHLVNKLEDLETLVEKNLVQQSKTTLFFESKELTLKADKHKETSLQKESTSRNLSDSTTYHHPSHFQDTNQSGCLNDLKPLTGKISANSAGKSIKLCTENNQVEERNIDLESNVENKTFSNLNLSKVECTPNNTDTKLAWRALTENRFKSKLDTETMEQDPERRIFSPCQYSEVDSSREDTNYFGYKSQNSQFGKEIGHQTNYLSLEDAFQDLENNSSNIPVIDGLSDDEENVGSVITEFKKKFHKGLLSIVQAGTIDEGLWKRKSSSLDYSEQESDYFFDNQRFGDRESKFYQEQSSSISSDDTTVQKSKLSEFLKSKEKQVPLGDSKQCNLLLKKEYQPIKIRPLEISKENKNTIHGKNIVAPFSSNAGSSSSNVSKVSIRTTIENNSFSIAKSSHCDGESVFYLSPTTAGFGSSKISEGIEMCNVVGNMDGLEPVPRFEKITDFVTHSTPIDKSFSNSCAISDESGSCFQTFYLRKAKEARQKLNVHKDQSVTDGSKHNILWQANFGPSMDNGNHDDSYSKNLPPYKFRSLSLNSDWSLNNRLDFEMQTQDENSYEKSRRSVDGISGYSLHGLPLAFQGQLDNNPKNIVVTPTPRPKSATIKKRLLSDAYCEKLKNLRVPEYAKRKSFENVSLNFRTGCTVQPDTMTTNNTFDSYVTGSTDNLLQKSGLEKMQNLSNEYRKRNQQKAKIPNEESDSWSNKSTRIWSNHDRIQRSRLLLQNDECKDPYGENFRLRKCSNPNWNGSLWTKQQDSIECRSYEENTREFSTESSTSVSDSERKERFASIKRNTQVGFRKQGIDLWGYRMKSKGEETVEFHIDCKRLSSDSSDEYYYGEDDCPYDESLNEIESVIIEEETDRLPSADKLGMQKVHDDSDLERIDCNCKNNMQPFQL